MHTDLPTLTCLPPGLAEALAPWSDALPPVPALALAALAAVVVAIASLFRGHGG